MRFLHGTSERDWLIIQQSGGLRNPYLTTHETVAWFFAETAADDARSSPVILDVEVVNLEKLEADLPMFQETIMEVLDELGYRSSADYHAAVKEGLVPWPRSARDWGTSLKTIGSVRYWGVIPAERVKVYDRAT